MQIQILKEHTNTKMVIQILKGKMVVEISNLELLRMCWSILEAILSAPPIGIPYFATFLQTFNLLFQKFFHP